MQPTPPTTWAEVPTYVRTILASPFVKRADGGVPGLAHAADVLGWRAGDVNAMWGGPRPLSNLIIGSGLGAGGGYLAGRLAEHFLPSKYFDPQAVRRRGMILGAALGAAVPAYQSLDAVRATGDTGALVETYPPTPDRLKAAQDKEAQDMFAPVIPVDQFNLMVMNDPRTPWRYRAATAGLIEAADAIRGTPDRFVSPFDIARIAAGAGVGLMSGVVAGKALGLLAGLTPQTQQKIQDLGLWAGVIQSVVPKVLGLR